MFSCLVLQDPEWQKRIPTRPQFDKTEYQGADVMDVESGVYQNIGILDIKAMYHSNADLYNISWETIAQYGEHGKDCGNGTVFTHGKKGLLVRQMDNMTRLRNSFKTLMRTDPDNFDRWDTMQYACKSLVASMYGVAGDAKYGLYHPEIAAAITYTSRQTLNKLKECAEEEGFSVIYGHTDSIFIQMPNGAEDGEERLKEINAEMAPIEVEFEKFCDSLILMAKNRYAGNVIWTDGVGHIPKLYIKGIEMKQSRMPDIMKSCMKETIEAILANKGEEETTERLKTLIVKVIEGKADPLTLCMKGKLGKNIEQYKVLSGASAGAAWANEYLGKGYRSGSFFKVTLDDKGKYIAFDDPKDIEGKYNIGFRHLAERFIIKKVEPYFNMMKWNTQPLYNALNGISALQWV
jgi:DNA polymerase elongation subunit (family B)